MKKTVFKIDEYLSSHFKDYKYHDEIYLVYDFQGNILAADKKYFIIEFYAKVCMKNMNVFQLIDESYHTIIRNRFDEIRSGKIPRPVEYKLKTIKGQAAYVEVSSILSDYLKRKVIISKVRNITLRKETENKVLVAVIQTEEKERQRFARDLHDELGPFLSGLKLYLHELNSDDLQKKEKKRLLEYLNLMTNEAVEKIRNIASNLIPQNMIETGVANTIDRLIKSLRQTGKIKIDFNTKGTETGLPDSLIITIYRIILELLNNSIKHSECGSINILLTFSDKQVKLNYSDNGKGFNIKKALQNKKGIGLESILNRIQLFQGTYIFRSQPGRGIKFDIFLPLK